MQETNEIRYQERKRWVFFGLPLSFTKYILKDDVLLVQTGLFTQKESVCYMYKIQDVEYQTSLFERLFKLGTVHCFTGDTTDSRLTLSHIKNSREIKDYITKISEEARIKRRTINTLDIGTDEMDEAFF